MLVVSGATTAAAEQGGSGETDDGQAGGLGDAISEIDLLDVSLVGFETAVEIRHLGALNADGCTVRNDGDGKHRATGVVGIAGGGGGVERAVEGFHAEALEAGRAGLNEW